MNRSVIDPGHGGSADKAHSTALGVCGPNGTLEKDVTLRLARRVAEVLGEAVLTRTTDENLSLAERAARAQEEQARTFISLHANRGAPGESGPQTFVHPRAAPSSWALAEAVQKELARLGGKDRGTTRAEMAVLTPERLGASTAACLVEVDYLSDPDAERRLNDARDLESIAQAIARGVQQHQATQLAHQLSANQAYGGKATRREAPGMGERYPGSRSPGRSRYGRGRTARGLAGDGGVSDAGAPDGGVSDAGVPSDGGAPDAGTPMTLSDDGARFIARYEGFRAKLYNDPAGHCTIGYGHLVHHGNCNGSEPDEFKGGISEERARDLLRQDAAEAISAIRSMVTVTLSQTQFDSLVSFVFNVGRGAFQNSTLLRVLNQGSYDQVPTQLLRWVKAGGKTMPGLVRRRTDEGSLFANGDYSGTSSAQGLALVSMSLDAALNFGVPGGVITDGFYRDAAEKQTVTGRSGGRAKHLGIDVSLSNAAGGGASDPRRGLAICAAVLGSIDIDALNSVRATDAQGRSISGLGIPGSGTATLRDAMVLTQPWKDTSGDAYGGVLGLACRYTYSQDDGTQRVFTLYLEFLHLITADFPPKDGSGNIISLDDFTAAGKSYGFGPQMVNRAVIPAADLLADPPLLVGHLGATQFPHCHLQAAFAMGEQGYLRAPRFDPTVMLVGS